MAARRRAVWHVRGMNRPGESLRCSSYDCHSPKRWSLGRPGVTQGDSRSPVTRGGEGERVSVVSVVVAGLEDLHFLVVSPVHQAMLVIDPAGPVSGQVALQWLGLPDTGEGVTLDLADQPGDPPGHLPVRAEPEEEVLPGIGVEVDAPHTSPARASSSSMVFVTAGRLSLSRATASMRRRALAGERSR